MPEDLGSIKIEFPDMFGGGTTTGPLPKSGGAGGAGAAAPLSFAQTVAKTAASLGNTFTALTSVVGDFVGKLSDYANTVQNMISRSISGIMEGGKYSGAVQMQAALIKMQGTLDLMAQGNMLSPLYTLVLRWYRELMAALAPVRMAISAIMTAIGGVLIVAVKALTPLIMNVTKAVLSGVLTVMNYLQGTSTSTAQGVAGGTLAAGTALTIAAIAGFFTAGPLGSLGAMGLVSALGLGATAMGIGATGVTIASQFDKFKEELAKANPILLKILEELEDANKKRNMQNPNAWVNQQLFDLTSHVTARRPTQYGAGTLGVP